CTTRVSCWRSTGSTGSPSFRGAARFGRVPRTRTPLPPPLPPETRTVGQLVAEALKLYGARFWPSLALGVGPAVFGVADRELEGAVRVVFDVLVGPLVFAGSYAAAVGLVRPSGRGRYVAVALAVGFVAFLPICLARVWIFPGID